MSRQNFFELLTNLSFDPPSKIPAIKTEIDNTIMSWQNQLGGGSVTDGAKRKELQDKLDLEKEMRDVLLNPAKLKAEADEMRQKQIGALEAELDIEISLGEDQHYTPRMIKEAKGRYRLSHITVRKTFETKGFIAADMEGTKEGDILPDAIKLSQLETLLQTIQTEVNPSFPDQSKVITVYDVISLLDKIEFSKWVDTKHWNVTQLQNRCNAIMGAYSTKNDTFSKACKDIASIGCTVLFKDELSRLKYDNACKVNELKKDPQIMKLAIASPATKKTQKVAEGFIAIIQRCFPNRNDALTVYNILAGIKDDPYEGPLRVTDIKYIVVCPECGSVRTFKTQEEAYSVNECSSGHKLYENCPKCKKLILRNHSVSCPKCGFYLAGMAQFDTHYSNAVKALKRNAIIEARSFFDQAESANPEDSRLVSLRKQIEEAEGALKRPLEELRKSLAEGRVFEAKQRINKLKANNPGLSFEQEERRIKRDVEDADRQMTLARSKTDSEEKARICLDILRIVSDYPEAIETLKKLVPASVYDLNITAADGDLHWNLKWKCNSVGSTYTVVRKDGAKPINERDGLVVAEGLQIQSYLDESVEPGIEYGYAVFAERGAVYSKPVSKLMMALHPELKSEDIQYSISDAGCTISWIMPQHCDGICVLKSKGNTVGRRAGSNTSSAYVRGNMYHDTDFEIGVDYRYRLYTVWINEDGEKEYSAEGILSDTIRIEPKPEIVLINKGYYDDGLISIDWQTEPRQGMIQFVKLNSRVSPLSQGMVIAASEISKYGCLVATERIASGECSFEEKENQYYYLMAVLPFSTNVLICNTITVNTAKKCSFKSVSINGDYLQWSLDVPRGVNRVYHTVSIAEDEAQADNIERSMKSRDVIGISSEEVSSYENGGTKSERIGEGIVLLAVYAEYVTNGRSFISSPSIYRVRNVPRKPIHYSINWKTRRFLFGSLQPILRVWTDDNSDLPEILCGSKSDGGMPLSAAACDYALYKIPAGTKSPFQIALEDTDKLPTGGYVRLYTISNREEYADPLCMGSMQKP